MSPKNIISFLSAISSKIQHQTSFHVIIHSLNISMIDFTIKFTIYNILRIFRNFIFTSILLQNYLSNLFISIVSCTYTLHMNDMMHRTHVLSGDVLNNQNLKVRFWLDFMKVLEIQSLWSCWFLNDYWVETD